MQLLRLEVRNWVHHRHRVCEFTRGLVAILGENGSGKSSLFGALRWLLTGDNPNYGSKADNISQYAKEGEPSYATLEFEHSGHIAVVTRHLLPANEQATLTIDGVEAGRGEKGVTAGIEKLLGVDAKFISRFIIVGQTEIFSFIDDSQTDTDKFFQRLFNTAKADKCQDLIGKNTAKISIPELAVTSGELATQVADADKELRRLEHELAQLPTMEQFFKLQTGYQTTAQAWEDRQKAAEKLAEAAGRRKQVAAELDTAQKECEQYATDLEALDEASQGQEQAISAARTALGHWQSYKSVAKAKENLQTSRAAIAEARANLTKPAAPGEISAVELRRDMDSKLLRIGELDEFVEMFVTEGVAECPTCHTPSNQLAGQVAKHNEALAELRTEVQDLKDAFLRQKKLETDWQTWESKQKELDLKDQQLTVAEQDLRVATPPELSEDELTKVVADYDSFQQARKEIAPLAEAAKLQQAKLAGTLTNIDEAIVTLSEQIRQATVSAADAELAAAALRDLKTQLAARAVVELNKADAAYKLKELNAQHAQAFADERKACKMRAWTGLSEKTREALKNAPRLVAQRNLQRLELAINELLQIFQVNFQVKVAEDGTPTFIAEFYDGRRQVAQRLSIGQKTVLALAFRVAVNAMFAEEIGLLALDEPTAALDQPRIRALAPVLEKLRELSTAKGLQCLLVTHAASLSNLFESAIELEPPELRHVTPG